MLTLYPLVVKGEVGISVRRNSMGKDKDKRSSTVFKEGPCGSLFGALEALEKGAEQARAEFLSPSMMTFGTMHSVARLFCSL